MWMAPKNEFVTQLEQGKCIFLPDFDHVWIEGAPYLSNYTYITTYEYLFVYKNPLCKILLPSLEKVNTKKQSATVESKYSKPKV